MNAPAHTPGYRVEVRTIDGSFGGIDREGGGHSFAQVQPVDPALFDNDLREANAERVRIAYRLVACWNALEGIPNPAAIADVVAALESILADCFDDECGDARHALASLRGDV
jgi:MFS-type transporter involved in bile tolerance (Atg22 family)